MKKCVKCNNAYQITGDENFLNSLYCEGCITKGLKKLHEALNGKENFLTTNSKKGKKNENY